MEMKMDGPYCQWAIASARLLFDQWVSTKFEVHERVTFVLQHVIDIANQPLFESQAGQAEGNPDILEKDHSCWPIGNVFKWWLTDITSPHAIKLNWCVKGGPCIVVQGNVIWLDGLPQDDIANMDVESPMHANCLRSVVFVWIQGVDAIIRAVACDWTVKYSANYRMCSSSSELRPIVKFMQDESNIIEVNRQLCEHKEFDYTDSDDIQGSVSLDCACFCLVFHIGCLVDVCVVC
jgi:hypothetical protein